MIFVLGYGVLFITAVVTAWNDFQAPPVDARPSAALGPRAATLDAQNPFAAPADEAAAPPRVFSTEVLALCATLFFAPVPWALAGWNWFSVGHRGRGALLAVGGLATLLAAYLSAKLPGALGSAVIAVTWCVGVAGVIVDQGDLRRRYPDAVTRPWAPAVLLAFAFLFARVAAAPAAWILFGGPQP